MAFQILYPILSNNRNISNKFYRGDTGVVPVDWAIKMAFQYGYLHHIARLMIMANFFNLCQIKPNHVYAWFMEFSLDSYDWVMINNVYSMGLYADGGLTTSKPYVSSGNYILGMSNFQKDGKWEELWKDLYYHFLGRNHRKLGGRFGYQLVHWKKLNDTEKRAIARRVNKFLIEI